MSFNRSPFAAAARLRRACLAVTVFATVPAAAAEPPGITPIPLTTPTTTAYAYPPEMRVGDFDGRVREATAFASTSFPQGRVAFWEAKAGTLKTDAYPLDEFVYVLEGELETVDRDGTSRHFGPGDTFVIPKGWAGEWRMKKDFRKLFVNF
ncbi:MAG: cupin domain-containing protein [Gammaproteobacteria bacterium]